jgi:hypothetical protein
MSDLENAVIDVANMQADELFAERVHKVLCEALGFGTDGVPFPKEVSKFSIVLEMAIRNIIHNEISSKAQAQAQLSAVRGYVGNPHQSQQAQQYQPSQQAFDKLFK